MITTTQNGPISVMSLVPADFPPIHDPSVFSLFQNSSLSLQFHCQGLGFSVIDSSPEECCYLFLDQIDAKAVVTEESQELLMNIACFQIDVSDYDAPFSTLLYALCEETGDVVPATPSNVDSDVERSPSTVSVLRSGEVEQSTRVSRKERKSILRQLKREEKQTKEIVKTAVRKERDDLMSCSSCGYLFRGKRPFLHVCGKRHLRQQNCMHIDRGLVSLERVVLTVDELFVDRLRRTFGPFFEASVAKEEKAADTIQRVFSETVYGIAALRSAVESRSAMSFFIDQFTLLPVSLIVSLKSSLGSEEDVLPSIESSPANRFLSCENMPIHLKAFDVNHVSGGYWDVFKAFRGYLVKEVLKQLWMCARSVIRRRTILSSVDLLGNLQYFHSEDQNSIQNLNYFGHSLQTLYSLSVQQDVVPALGLPSSSGRDVSLFTHHHNSKGIVKAVGTAVDGIAHVSSRVCAESGSHA